jgi:DNA-binding transcriptional ArsR family regulator
MAMSRQDKNDAVISALGHPLRREILRYLENHNNGGVSPSTLATELDEKLPNLSYHVRLLVKAGALKLVTTKPRRGAIEHYYKRSGNSIDKQITEVLNLIGKS